MIMPNRDNSAKPLSGPWEGGFHRIVVEKGLVPEGEAKYFVDWVSRFLQTTNAHAAQLAPDAVCG
jgi:hypothetical protein